MNIEYHQATPELAQLIIAYELGMKEALANAWSKPLSSFKKINSHFQMVKDYYDKFSDDAYVASLISESLSQTQEEDPLSFDALEGDLNYAQTSKKEAFDISCAHIELLEDDVFALQRIELLAKRFHDYATDNPEPLQSLAITQCEDIFHGVDLVKTRCLSVLHKLSRDQYYQTKVINDIAVMREDIKRNKPKM